MKRRELLQGACLTAAAATVGAGPLAGCRTGTAVATRSRSTVPVSRGADEDAAPQAPSAPDDSSNDDWGEVRRQFLLDPEVVHLGSLLLSSHPWPVREAIRRHREGLDRNPVQYWRENNVRLRSEARAAAARYWGIEPTHVALTESTTQGLATLYNGLRLEPGDHVVTSRHDHPATRRSLEYKAERSGARVETIELYGGEGTPASTEVTEESLVKPYLDAITDRTRAVAATWVHSVSGVKLPVRALAEGLAAVNATRDPEDRVLLCVDGVHGFGVEDEDMKSLGADFFAAGFHKWIFGPRGTGGLFAARPETWSRVTPTIPSFGPLHTPGGLMSPGGFHAFEHRWSVPEAFAFIEGLGRERVAQRTHALARQFKEGLRHVPKAVLHTPLDSGFSSGIVCFEIEGMKTSDLVERMWRRGIVITEAPYASRYARVTPSIVNTPEDIDAVLRALRVV